MGLEARERKNVCMLWCKTHLETGTTEALQRAVSPIGDKDWVRWGGAGVRAGVIVRLRRIDGGSCGHKGE